MKIHTIGHATLEVLINEEHILSFENWENNITHLKNVLLYLNMNNVNCSIKDVKYQQVIGDDELFRFKIFWDTDNVPEIRGTMADWCLRCLETDGDDVIVFVDHISKNHIILADVLLTDRSRTVDYFPEMK